MVPVYVDNARLPYGRMVMCHMMADTGWELSLMLDQIGVPEKWIQKRGTWREHADICLAKRALAIRCGALKVSSRNLARLLKTKSHY